ncbi:MAG: alpha/beta fold hydrolase, partial [Ornithinimicrobium sp.]
HPALRISTHIVDLAESDQIEPMVASVLTEHEHITLLINNAGIALGGRFDQISAEEFDWLMQVNLHAPIALVRAFLPARSAAPGAQIVNVSSLFGLVAPGGQTAYVTSKYALRGFSQSLGHDLAASGIGVTSVHPSGVRTRIALDSRTPSGLDEGEAKSGREAFHKLLRIDPADAARTILRGTERRRSRVLVGGSAVALDLLERAVPAAGGRVLSAVQRRTERSQASRAEVSDVGSSVRQRVSALDGIRTVEAAGTQVRVRITGPAEGDPVMMIHGIGRSLEDWTEQHALLSQDHRLISLDLPGFGYTPPVSTGMGLKSLADAAVATLDALGEDRPVHLVGNSLGGAIAMNVLARNPERVRSLALSASAGFGSEVTPALRIISINGIGPWLLARSSRSATRKVERSLYADPSYATEARIDLALELAAVPRRATNFRRAMLSVGGVRGTKKPWRDELLSTLTAYPVPTLVVWGENDQVLPCSHLEAAAQAMPHAKTVLMPNTGHMPQAEQAEDFAALVAELWQSCDRAGATQPVHH